MKHTKLALFTFLLCGTLSACKPDSAPSVVEAPPPVVEPAVPPAPGPVATDPVITDPAITDPSATPAPVVDAAGTEGDEDTPHSGGDKVGKPPSN